MSNDTSTPAATKTADTTEAAGTKKPVQERVYLVSYPKVIFLYPSFIMAVFCGIYLSFIMGDQPDPASSRETAVTLTFLLVLGVNLVVLGFDFPRTTSLTLFFVGATLALGMILLFTFQPEVLGSLRSVLEALRPVANPTFYFFFAGMLGLIYIAVLISVNFDYWEVRPNELLHHHGVLSNLERFAAPNLRIEKEIVDVFEYLLLRSGRLILTPREAPRPIVLDNVLFISKKEKAITRMLGALQVQVRQDH